MKAPRMFTSWGETPAKPNRQNSWWFSSRTKAPRCWCPLNDQDGESLAAGPFQQPNRCYRHQRFIAGRVATSRSSKSGFGTWDEPVGTKAYEHKHSKPLTWHD